MKINKILSTLLISIALFASVNAHATPYLIGQIGLYGLGDNDYFENLFDNERRITGRVGGGYLWDVNDNLKMGIEGGLHLNQNFEDNGYDMSLTFKRYSIDILGVLDYHFDNHINIFAKAGFAYISDEFKMIEHYFSVSKSDQMICPKAVLGIGYDLNANINVNIAFAHEFFNTNSNYLYGYVPASSSAMLGLTYRFL